MTDEGAIARIILRAEIAHAGGVIVTHTLEVGSDSVCVASPAVVAEGDMVRIVLSFPGLIQTFEVTARAAGSLPADGHGRPASIAFTVEGAAPEARATLSRIAMLNRRDTPSQSMRRASVDTSRYRCLLVEDNGFIRDLFSYALDRYVKTRNTGVSLELAASAEDAWMMMRDHDFDIAIIDYYLPAQSGSELIARMRAEPRLARMPVVAISIGGAEAREASMAAGADLFLDKPIVMRDLFTTLDRLARPVER
jgi:CheY-like chemotaxis protein